MKKLQDLQKEYSENIKEADKKECLPKRKKALSTRNKFLKEMILFLETNPNEDYLKSEKKRLLKIVSAKKEQYDYWSSNNCPKDLDVKKRVPLFNREMGITKMNKQIKTINYLIG